MPSINQPGGSASGNVPSYVDWQAIIAGAVLSCAISVVLITFGSGIGLSMMSLEPGDGVSLRWVTIAGGLWFIWVAVSSFSAGGYLAGRLRRPTEAADPDEIETRDGAHGVLVWATGALLGATLAVTGVTGLIGGAARTAGAAGGTAAEAVDLQLDYFAGAILRSDAGNLAESAEARSQIATILQYSIVDGEVPAADRAYMAQIVASETDLAEPEAQAQVDTAIAEFQDARQAMIDAGEQARIASLIGAFVIAATLMASAAAAYFAATFGGQHRDQNLAFRSWGH